MTSNERTHSLKYQGYNIDLTDEWDRRLCSVARRTPGGEYHRRYWQPIAYVSDLGEVPLAVRALGEDLVAFRDKTGAIGVLQRPCCHRNTSLEFGIIEEHGIRCCYHGRVFDVDGSVLEMPGEPAEARLKKTISQGSYPVHEFAGIVFIYMGPPERIPVFPVYDRFNVPGINLVPGSRWSVDCNWLQIQENLVDPYHTAVLHTIPQRRGAVHLADEFESTPLIIFTESAAGLMYIAARYVEDNIWVRSAEAIGPNVRFINSFFEDGRQLKYSSQPWMSFWMLPVDDFHSTTFYVSHVAPDEPVPLQRRRELEDYGQIKNRSYAERQWIPGDSDAQESQGAVTVHANEHLGAIDRGIVQIRRYLRANIDAVEAGQNPHGVFWEANDVPPTATNNLVVPISQVENGAQEEGLRSFMEGLVSRYRERPPMQELDYTR